MIKLAFYKGRGDMFDRLIRLWTRSQYSHVEIIVDGIWYSSSPRDGRVRAKTIRPKRGHWDFRLIPLFERDKASMLRFLESQTGKQYDWTGIFLSQIVPLNVQDPRRWFCSEICSAALKAGGIKLEKSSQWYSPARLYKEMRWV